MKKENGIKMRQLMLYSIVAALGGLLFGFDIAIITGAGPFLTIAFEYISVIEYYMPRNQVWIKIVCGNFFMERL